MTPTPDEEATIEEVIEENNAERFNDWSRVDPDQDLARTDDEVLAQWESEDGKLVMVVTRDERDDEVQYNARVEALEDDVPFSRRHPARWKDSLETALNEAIEWLRYHQPGVPFPTFSLRVEGGIFKPLVDLLRRFGGGDVLIDVRDDSIVFESASHVNAVDFRITQADMEEFSVDQEGEAVVDSDFMWDALKPVNFSDIVPVAMDGGVERPRLQVASQSTPASISADFLRRQVPEAYPYDARFTVPGLEYRDKIRAAGIIEADDTILGVRDGVAFFRVEDRENSEEVTGRFDATDVEGEQVVIVASDRLQELRRAVPRPSQTPLTFTFPGNKPMLVEYTVGETDVDVRIALKRGAVPREVEMPPEEVVVPEGEEVPDEAESDEQPVVAEGEEVDAALEEAIEEVNGGTDDEGGDEGEEEMVKRTLRSVEWELLVEALDWSAAQASEQDSARSAIIMHEIADDLREQSAPTRELEADDWATAVSVARFVANEAEMGDDPEDAADDLRLIADKLESHGKVGEPRVEIVQPEDPGDGDGEPPTGGDPGVIELAIRVEEAIGNRYVYAPPPQSVSLAISEEIADATEERLGPANPNLENVRVGTAFVTDDEVATNREFLRVEVDENYLPDDEEGEDEREVPPEGEMEPEAGEADLFVRSVGGTPNYVVEGSHPSEVEDEAIEAALETLGPPGQFDLGEEVGRIEYRGDAITAFDFEGGQEALTEAPDEDGEEVEEAEEVELEEVVDDVPEGFGVTVEGTFDDEVIEEGEFEEVVEEVDELSKSQVEVIVEGATIGVTAQARIVQGRLIDIILSLEHASPVSFTTDAGSVKTIMGDTRRQSVHNAIERWEAVVRIGSLTDGQVASINEARVELNDQFDLDISLLEPSDIEGFSEGDVREITDGATAGVSVEVRANPDADSLRINMEPDPASDVAFAGSLQEVQGALSNPGGVIRDALEEWRENVDLATLDIDSVSRARTRLEKRFDVSLPRVEDPDDGDAPTGDRGELLDVWTSLTVDMETVEIDEGELVQQGGYSLPVEIDNEFAQFADEEGKTQIEQGLTIHHTDAVHDEVHAIIARALDAEPENFYDGSKESELDHYDRFYRFTLTRNSAPGAWTNPRFAPSTLFKLLEPVNGTEIKVVSRGSPLA